jgi:hypothetical protein
MNVQRVYNVVCLLINSIESKRFKQKAQRMHQTISRQNLSRKTAAAKRIFLPYLNSSEKSAKYHVYRE